MSKIAYCSLEEAWGTSFKEKDDKIDNKYDKMDTERINVISNMNKVERSKVNENNSIIEYEKYRFNPENKVLKNSNDPNYSPFNESIEKKYLQDKLNYLENEFKRYKHLFDKTEENNNSTNTSIEHFQNETNKNSKSNDIIDLILLIIIGLIVIFVMNSIFNIGKIIGAKNSIMIKSN